MQRKTKFQVRSEAAKKRWQRDEDKESFWRSHIEAWRTSGLSVRKFCHVNFVTESSFRSWRRELALRDRESSKPSDSGAKSTVPKPPFVAIRLVPDQPLQKETVATCAGLPARNAFKVGDWIDRFDVTAS